MSMVTVRVEPNKANPDTTDVTDARVIVDGIARVEIVTDGLMQTAKYITLYRDNIGHARLDRERVTVDPGELETAIRRAIEYGETAEL